MPWRDSLRIPSRHRRPANAPGGDWGLTRRGLLTGAAAVGVGAGLDHVLSATSASDTQQRGNTPQGAVDFYGPNQAGIATPAQDYLSFAAFDMTSEDPEALRQVLQRWSAAAASLTQGQPYQRRSAGSRPATARPRRGGWAGPRAADDHDRPRPQPVRLRRRRQVRAGRAATARARAAAPVPGRQPRPRKLRWRPVRAGVRRRPAGGLPRYAPARAHRRRTPQPCAGHSSASAAPPARAPRRPPRAT